MLVSPHALALAVAALAGLARASRPQGSFSTSRSAASAPSGTGSSGKSWSPSGTSGSSKSSSGSSNSSSGSSNSSSGSSNSSSGSSGSTGTSSSSSSGSTGTSSTSSSSSGTSSGTSSSSASLTYQQFCDCVAAYSKTTAGGTPPTPSESTYNDFNTYAAQGYGLNEQVMMLSNMIWETGGLQYLSENCSSDSCSSYGNYYGRGYLQLTWQDNYTNASTDIYSSDTLVNNPDQVAESPGSWQTAAWYWNKIVHPYITDSVLSSYDLGTSVKQINGSVECTSPCPSQPQNRLTIYNSCLSTVGISGTGTLSGCCTS